MGIDTKLVLMAGIAWRDYAHVEEQSERYRVHDRRTGQPLDQWEQDTQRYWVVGGVKIPIAAYNSVDWRRKVETLAEDYDLVCVGDDYDFIVGVIYCETEMSRAYTTKQLQLDVGPSWEQYRQMAHERLAKFLASLGAETPVEVLRYAVIDVSA